MTVNYLIVLGAFFIASLLILRMTPNDKIKEMAKFYKKILPSIPFTKLFGK